MAENYISIISGKVAARIKVSDVVFIERNCRKLRIVTDDEEYSYYEKIENISPLLDDRFYPCLKGCYINLEKVTSMSEQCIRFENGKMFNLGRENFIKAKQRYRCFLQRTLQDKEPKRTLQ